MGVVDAGRLEVFDHRWAYSVTRIGQVNNGKVRNPVFDTRVENITKEDRA